MSGRIFILLFYAICIAYPYFSAHAITCDSTQYTDGQYCYTCPANASCDGVDFTCNDGWYKDNGICSQCSIPNSTCTGPDDYSCMPGFYDNNGTCNACPENANCAGGHEYFYCQPGYYKQQYLLTNTPLCLSCDNHICDGETLISCGAGYYLHYTKVCKTCSDAQYCPAGTTQIICKEGYYKDSNGSCQRCPTGYYCPFNTLVENCRQYCASGYYRTGGSCTECPDNIVCPGGKTDEMTCPDGLYLHDNGQCLSYAPGDCGVAPNCNPGCWNNNGTCTPCITENATCTNGTDFTCMAGYYKNGASCDICPENSNCPAGSTQISCLDGYYLKDNKCTICEAYGYYCTENTRYECPPVIADETIKLPNGHRFLSYKNFYTSPPNGATLNTQCYVLSIEVSAPEGNYTILSSNKYNGTVYDNTQGVKKSWTSASTGRYLAEQDTNTSYNTYYNNNLPCTNGAENSYYTGAGSPDGNDCPWVCNDGFYRDGNECLVCPDGMECVGGGIICPIGMYANKNQCMPCPTGYTDAQTTGAQSINACQKRCGGGSYIATAQSATCENVGSNYWIAENYTNYGAIGTRNMCDSGMTTLGYGTGADEASDCGRTLHIGENEIHLRSGRQTTPSLVIRYPDQTLLYGNLSTDTHGHVRIRFNNKTYSVYDESMIEP